MRRIAKIAAVLSAIAVAFVVATGASSPTHKTYLVRAIFDDASFAVQGEDVRIAGANVGSIQSLGVTSGKRAEVTISINNPDFTPFHTNAHCAIRPQSLIGEEYVDCQPGTSSAPALPLIKKGHGTGSHYLPVTRTSSPIDTDIVQNISQEPVRQSLGVIIDELGTGLAARGSDLNAVIHRANPALGDTDKVIQILARQNRQLAQLATDSDTVLAPLARERHQISTFVTQANATSVASAQRAADISKTFHLFPTYLRQLKPLLADLSVLADQGTPLMTTLGKSASALGQQFANLTPFAQKARTALIDLGNASAQSQPALLASMPLAQRLDKLGTAAKPTAKSLDRLLASLENTGGIQQLMGVLFNGAVAGNGFDSLGHYVRDEPLVSSCTSYVVRPVLGCSANFSAASAAAASVSTDSARTASAAGTAALAPPSSKLAGRIFGAPASAKRDGPTGGASVTSGPDPAAGGSATTNSDGQADAAGGAGGAGGTEGGIVSQAVRHANSSRSRDLKGLLGYLIGGRP
ncbi:MAG TPA: MlaD family protein [Solirubrobacteraceae bacterium]|nr:MlaD family protein [Solirubrobacteraceae bacterium]